MSLHLKLTTFYFACYHIILLRTYKTKLMYKVLGKVIEAAKEEDKKVLLVRQNKAKILKVFIGQHSS